ncbi:MAG: HAD family hydrolase [Cumulibacter sp.]
MADLVVGFDLDMTLVDSRPGITAVLEQLNVSHGYRIDADAVVSKLGPPFAEMIAPYVAEECLAHAVEQYRTLYPSIAIASTEPLPGAREALDYVRDAGYRLLVLTGKFESNARLHLEALGFPYDRLVGARWASGKTEVLREESATVYVGDHAGDMRSAKDAGAIAVGVPTGGLSAEELRLAGADVVLDSLWSLPDWLRDNL